MKRGQIIPAIALCLSWVVATSALAVESPVEEDKLAEYVRIHPTDYEAAFRYVRLSIERQDYEPAISTLQRILSYNPKLAQARKELGFLYARIGSYQSAAVNLKEALASPDLDAAQKAQIEAQLPEIEKQYSANRLSGRLQIGLRSQSNANYFPAGGLFDVGGIQTSGFGGRRPDTNTFQLGQLSHDYDFQNQRGDTLETRGVIYATQQFSLSQYNVAMLSGSTGPRLALFSEAPKVTVRPYLVGAVSSLGGVDYLNAGGAGFTVRTPVGDRVTIEPGFEWRRLYVNSSAFPDQIAQTSSWLASGDVYTWLASGNVHLAEGVKLEGRAAYSLANARLAAQHTDQFDLQALLRFEFSPLLPQAPRPWTIAPYGRYQNIAFAAPNLFVNPLIKRHDFGWTAGLALDAPLEKNLGFEAHIEYFDYVSNVPGFSLKNASITFGPTAKF